MTEQPDRPDDSTLMAYVRGDLPPDAAAEVERAAREQPAVAGDIALMRGLVRARAADPSTAPGELGWARLSRAIDAEAAPVHQPRRNWRPLMQIAATAVIAVGVWQLAVVPMLPGGGGDLYVPATGTTEGAVIVAFAPDATEAQIRALLQEIGATVTDGPSALGLWTLSFADERRRTVGLTRLQAATGIVESVQAD